MDLNSSIMQTSLASIEDADTNMTQKNFCGQLWGSRVQFSRGQKHVYPGFYWTCCFPRKKKEDTYHNASPEFTIFLACIYVLRIWHKIMCFAASSWLIFMHPFSAINYTKVATQYRHIQSRLIVSLTMLVEQSSEPIALQYHNEQIEQTG